MRARGPLLVLLNGAMLFGLAANRSLAQTTDLPPRADTTTSVRADRLEPSDLATASWIKARKLVMGRRDITTPEQLNGWLTEALAKKDAQGLSDDAKGALDYFAATLYFELADRNIDDRKNAQAGYELLKQSEAIAPWRLETAQGLGRAAKVLTELNWLLRRFAKMVAHIDTDSEVRQAVLAMSNAKFNDDPMCQLLLVKLGPYAVHHSSDQDKDKFRAISNDAQARFDHMNAEHPELIVAAQKELDGDHASTNKN
jgi:hypothetical protein